MRLAQKFEESMRDLEARQRNYVFPSTARNMARFWRGLYRQKLNRLQTAGFVVLIAFYVLFISLLVYSHWQDLRTGYWLYALLSLPLVGFFLLLRWSLREKK